MFHYSGASKKSWNSSVECGFKNYFDASILDALKRITHDKAMGYEEYIEICLMNPVSALVKMIDMEDNLRVLDLVEYNEERFRRAQGYLFWTFSINHAYHFVENGEKYRKEFRKNSNIEGVFPLNDGEEWGERHDAMGK